MFQVVCIPHQQFQALFHVLHAHTARFKASGASNPVDHFQTELPIIQTHLDAQKIRLIEIAVFESILYEVSRDEMWDARRLVPAGILVYVIGHYIHAR